MEAAASTMATLAAGQSNMDYWSSLVVQVSLGCTYMYYKH